MSLGCSTKAPMNPFPGSWSVCCVFSHNLSLPCSLPGSKEATKQGRDRLWLNTQGRDRYHLLARTTYQPTTSIHLSARPSTGPPPPLSPYDPRSLLLALCPSSSILSLPPSLLPTQSIRLSVCPSVPPFLLRKSLLHPIFPPPFFSSLPSSIGPYLAPSQCPYLLLSLLDSFFPTLQWASIPSSLACSLPCFFYNSRLSFTPPCFFFSLSFSLLLLPP